MIKEEYHISIEAPREKVWQTLWEKETYEDWTSVFSEGSTVETDWQEGSRVKFLGSSGEGMVAEIAKKEENRFLSFRHLGMIDKQGREDLDSEAVRTWAGALENYSLDQEEGMTHLRVTMDMPEKNREFFQKIWPKALKRIKELAEQ